ncbi:hypothetical protein [Chlorogloeopsis sp. ULAP02]|uniref:hypothetical protein n=1 Tax=Chlorogloeopsis sp. ULAP02 TaxID=3107926 RepID=UPI00313479C7
MYKIGLNKSQKLSKTVGSSLLLAIAWLLAGINTTFAQQKNLPVCQPPNSGEYLLLVISPTPDNQNQLRRALPNEIKTTTCRYLTDTVTRIGGFTKIDDANRWARYINSIVGLTAIITTRPGEHLANQTTPKTPTLPTPPTTPTLPTPPTTPTTQLNQLNQLNQTATYQPQRLKRGFAVLVDYFNRPEVANQIKEIVRGDVGFVSYGQRPYLLATYTTNQQDAYSTLQKLSERGFFAVIVDSSKVMLLRPIVNLPNSQF